MSIQSDFILPAIRPSEGSRKQNEITTGKKLETRSGSLNQIVKENGVKKIWNNNLLGESAINGGPIANKDLHTLHPNVAALVDNQKLKVTPNQFNKIVEQAPKVAKNPSRGGVVA